MKPIIKVPLIYGAIAGALGFIIVVALYYLGRHPFLIPVYVDYRIALLGIFIFFCLREFREVHQNGILYFWQGLIASFLLVTTFAILASTAIWIFCAFVPGFVESYITLTIEQLNTLPPEIIERIGKNVVESNLKTLPSTNAFELVKLYLWQSYVIGAFISIILSVITRRQPKP